MLFLVGMEIYHDTLFVGGQNGNNIMAYDTSWIYVGEMNGNRTRALAVFNDKLYAGGEFYHVADTIISCSVAMWDGFEWTSTGQEIFPVYENGMAIYRGDLYVGGNILLQMEQI